MHGGIGVIGFIGGILFLGAAWLAKQGVIHAIEKRQSRPEGNLERAAFPEARLEE